MKIYTLSSGASVFVDTLKSGQSRPYADHEYEYRIQKVEGVSDEEMKHFCTTVLHPKKLSRREFETAKGTFWDGYYEFKVCDDCYIYTIWEPYCD